ncbi:hypothetical protein V0288_08305 [Pannus brasiliensis CCIBt3594]|uniref:DUF6883 domain-containing protein n=1 Tax=Pannus brasiliensis CCIBt3594 TaxID=1427578 RepID=A0AAW9QH45_9CHRO
MKLPNIDRAILDFRKLSGYCLNPDHPDGKHKARVFQSVLGLTKENEQELHDALQDALGRYDAIFEENSRFGDKYIIDFPIIRNNRTAIIHSVWIIRYNENFPRLVTCYIL